MSRRRSAGRSPYDRVLVVTEGSETEPTYFRDLRDDIDPPLTSVNIDGSCDSNPISVVEYGLNEYRRDGDYDRLYCIFDRDRREEFTDAIERLSDVRDPPEWDVRWTYSIPCFEYWILLHYTLTGRRFEHPTSPCGQVIDEVENYLPNYSKGMRSLYERTKGNMDTAMGNAQQRWGQAKNTPHDNPRTKVHKLISYLKQIRGEG